VEIENVNWSEFAYCRLQSFNIMLRSATSGRSILEFHMMLKFAATLPALIILASSAHAVEQDFVYPKVGIFRLDWCKVAGAECGLPAADKFCQSRNFVHATNFEKAVGIGAATPTIVIGTGQQCGNATCDGFTFITCQKPDVVIPLPPPPLPLPPDGGASTGGDTHLYKKPKVGGKRLNYCETKGVGCGDDAAAAFCDSKGYDDASDYEQSPPAPPNATRYIGNGKLCKGPICYAFTSILCENQ
jgi:hypothetical protein